MVVELLLKGVASVSLEAFPAIQSQPIEYCRVIDASIRQVEPISIKANGRVDVLFTRRVKASNFAWDDIAGFDGADRILYLTNGNAVKFFRREVEEKNEFVLKKSCQRLADKFERVVIHERSGGEGITGRIEARSRDGRFAVYYDPADSTATIRRKDDNGKWLTVASLPYRVAFISALSAPDAPIVAIDLLLLSKKRNEFDWARLRWFPQTN